MAFPVRSVQATGIPRAFLETVEESDLTDGSVALPGGGFAKVKTNDNNFSDLAIAAEIDFDNDPSMGANYKCQLCSGVMVSAVSVPCCNATFCDKCVRKKLVATNFHCPGCKKQISPDLLVPQRELRAEIEQAKRKRVAEIMAQRKSEQKVRFLGVIARLTGTRKIILFFIVSCNVIDESISDTFFSLSFSHFLYSWPKRARLATFPLLQFLPWQTRRRRLRVRARMRPRPARIDL